MMRTHHIRKEDEERYTEIAEAKQIPDMLTWAIKNYEITEKPKIKKVRPKYVPPKERIRGYQKPQPRKKRPPTTY